MEYYGDKEVLCWASQVLRRSPALQNYKDISIGSKSRLIHDVWNAYAYGNVVKLVYIKKAPVPKNKDDISTADKVCEKVKTSVDNSRFNCSVSRSRSRVYELSMCNEFRHFCTFTLNGEWKDRENLKDYRKELAMLVRNLNRGRSDKIKYLLIPERHKKGGWHLHGFFMGLTDDDLTPFKVSDKIPQKMKKQLKNGEKLFNFPRYSQKFGFCSISEIKDRAAVSAYITKYITKDLGGDKMDKGEHLFFASQGLKGREVLAKNCSEAPPFDDWDFENDYVKIKTVTVQKNGQ